MTTTRADLERPPHTAIAQEIGAAIASMERARQIARRAYLYRAADSAGDAISAIERTRTAAIRAGITGALSEADLLQIYS